jgi:hypothetical protein
MQRELVSELKQSTAAGLAANKRFLNAWMDYGLASTMDLSMGVQGAVFADPETGLRIGRFLDRRKG